jgi:Mg2+ and Co2+ transporter CorA
MKTLAVVTVAFLPATFVASFFAVPLFNWDADQSAPSSRRDFGNTGLLLYLSL